MNKIFIFNTGISNLLSVRFAFEKLNYDVDIGKDLSMLSYGDTLVIPGVGHFDSIIKNIGKKNIKLIKNLIINKEVSYLGICLGLQILFENSSEGNMSGLGLIKGGVEKLSTKFEDSQIPETHIGWKNVYFTNNSPPIIASWLAINFASIILLLLIKPEVISPDGYKSSFSASLTLLFIKFLLSFI